MAFVIGQNKLVWVGNGLQPACLMQAALARDFSPEFKFTVVKSLAHDNTYGVIVDGHNLDKEEWDYFSGWAKCLMKYVIGYEAMGLKQGW